MSHVPLTYSTAPVLRPWGLWADAVLAVLLVAWTAEALGRLPMQTALTGLIYAGLSARMLLRLGPLIDTLRRHWPLLLFPGVALLSTLWSPVSTLSLTAAVQLTFTICAGLYLGGRFGLRGLLWCVFAGLSLAMLASALGLLGLTPPHYAPSGGFMGVFLQKNGLGQRAVILLLVTVLLWRGSRSRALLAGSAALTVLMLVLSQSITSLVIAVVGLVVFAAVESWRAGGLLRSGMVVAVATSGALVLALLLLLGIDPVADGLALAGKSSNLTGRTILWDVAIGHAAERPVLGIGYMAYWQAPAFAQEVAILRGLYGHTVSVFHNFALEILVGLGLPGVLAMAVFLGHVGWTLRTLAAGDERRWSLLFLLVLIGLSLLGASLHRPHELVILLLPALVAARGDPHDRSGAAYS